jgi:hypothetical protein
MVPQETAAGHAAQRAARFAAFPSKRGMSIAKNSSQAAAAVKGQGEG